MLAPSPGVTLAPATVPADATLPLDHAVSLATVSKHRPSLCAAKLSLRRRVRRA